MLRLPAAICVIVAAFLVVDPASASCPTCDTQIAIRGNQIRCLERRLTPSLKGAYDPIFISLANCDGAKDEPRLDPPASVPSLGRKSKPKSIEKRAYLLSRSDAECLVRQLETRPRKAKEFVWDRARC